MPAALPMLALALSTLVMFSDLYARRVPNTWLLAALAMGMGILVLQSLFDKGRAGWPSLSGFAIGLLIFLPFYAIGWMGAGDVKFFAVLGFLLGYRALLPIWLIGGLLTGAHAVVIVLSRRPLVALVPSMVFARERLATSRLWRHTLLARQGRSGQPHAAYLAIGAAVTILQPTLFAWVRQ
jgi:prepilin peptidase CpaA